MRVLLVEDDEGVASAVPMIIMTARDSDGAVVLGLRAGADDYLVKPVRKAVLLARIQAVMRRVHRGEGPTVTYVRPGCVLSACRICLCAAKVGPGRGRRCG
jgi:DNA-binding response OmpR family regulator